MYEGGHGTEVIERDTPKVQKVSSLTFNVFNFWVIEDRAEPLPPSHQPSTSRLLDLGHGGIHRGKGTKKSAKERVLSKSIKKISEEYQ